ncbi:MAG: NUDIX hydrolase [Gemmiger sp.]|uniref:NUDIX hydrolase n=1 Tax=Gemmiger sp. TaxID=2049027 RepID=UPI002E79D025|nr:NUDIX hydrolase [Gemmiger sp.]MEE0800533.1 NUDIX hydrolase [Gemmiger sp.]
MAHTEQTLDSRQIFEGRVFRVTVDKVQLENGSTSTREIVHHHGGACVLAVTEDDRLYLVRQYRYALQEELWELPAGKLEAGEDPLAAARRELEEECGVTADRVFSLGVLYPTVGYDSEKIYLWAAQGLHRTSQHLDEGEFLDATLLPFDEVLQMILRDEIRDSKTVAAVLKYDRLRREGKV